MAAVHPEGCRETSECAATSVAPNMPNGRGGQIRMSSMPVGASSANGNEIDSIAAFSIVLVGVT